MKTMGESQQAPVLSADTIEGWRQRIRIDTFSQYHEHMGVALALQRENDAAEAAFRRALAIDPRRFASFCYLADLYRRTGRQPQADAVLADARALDPAAEALGRVAQARIAFDAERYDDAETALKAVLELSAADTLLADLDLVVAIADRHWMAKRFVQARAWLEHIDTSRQHSAAYHRVYARILQSQGEAAECIRHLGLAVEIEPGDFTCRYHLASTLMNRLKFKEASDHFAVLLANADQSATTGNVKSARLQLARVRHLSGDPDQAEEMFGAIIDSDPGMALSWLYRGLCRLHQGKSAAAETDIAKAMQLASGNPIVQVIRGILYLTKGDHARARDVFADVISRNPDHPLALLGMACVHIAAGQEAAAQAIVTTCLTPTGNQIAHIGIAVRTIGKPAQPLLPLLAAAGYDGPL